MISRWFIGTVQISAPFSKLFLFTNVFASTNGNDAVNSVFQLLDADSPPSIFCSRLPVLKYHMRTLDNVLFELKKRGFKSTKYRTSLLRLLFDAGKPVSVHELLEMLKDHGMDPNKTTVYREVYFLVEQKIVSELNLGDDKKRYEMAHLDHHHHLICTNCQSIQDVVLEENLAKIESKIAQENAFKISDHTMEFYGLCRNCQ